MEITLINKILPVLKFRPRGSAVKWLDIRDKIDRPVD